MDERTWSYRNPWHDGTPNYGPPEFERTTRPRTYRGYSIFKVHDRHYDVVRDGVAVTQRAGPNGARRAVDALVDVPD